MAANYGKYKRAWTSLLFIFLNLYLESKGQCLESTNMIIVLKPLGWGKHSSNDRGVEASNRGSE